MAYGLCGKIVATEGHGDVLAQHLLEAAAALDDVATCQMYVVSRDPGDADAVWVIEVWENAAAHRSSLELEPIQELITRARPVIAGMGDRFELLPMGGKGLTQSDR